MSDETAISTTASANYEASLPPASRVRRAWYAFSVTGFAMATMAVMAFLTMIYGWKTAIAENYNDNMTYIVGICVVMYVGGSIVDNSGFLGNMGGFFANRGARKSVGSVTVEATATTNGGVG